MAIKDYRIAVITSKCGLTDYQLRRMVQELSEASKVVEGLILLVPGFKVAAPEKSVDPGIINVARQKGATLVFGAFAEGPQTEGITAWLREQRADKILGFPARSKKSHSKDRVWLLHREFGVPRRGQPTMEVVEHLKPSDEESLL
jgi:hypothetical protein